MPEETKGKISIVVTAKNGFNVMVPQPSWLLPVREKSKGDTKCGCSVGNQSRTQKWRNWLRKGFLRENVRHRGLCRPEADAASDQRQLQNVKIIERDKGSEPPGTDFDPGHSRNGANEAAEVSETNQLQDNVMAGIFAADVEHARFPSRGTGYVRGASMMEKGEGTEYLDGREIMEVRCHFSFSDYGRKSGGRSDTIS